MDLWQYNAWCEAYKLKVSDTLSIQVQAAYMSAYWNGFNKHKKSLNDVLKAINSENNKKFKRKPIDVDKISEQFKQMEELKHYGWTKERNTI